MTLTKFAKALGRQGGLARAKRLSSKRKKQIASLGALSRSESIQTAKRIEVNFRYLKALHDLSPPPKVHSLKSIHIKLPGIYG